MPPHPPILALGYSEAAMLLRSPSCPTISAILSIHSPTEYPLDLPLPLRLGLSFDDTPAPDPADPFATYHAIQQRRASADNGRPLTPPTEHHVQQIIDFAHATRAIPGTLLCHCSGGLSRSPAAALICLAVWTGPGHEPYCHHYLRQLRPHASPHPDLLRIADRLLSRQGRLALPAV